MKKAFLFLLTLFLLISCNKDEDPITETIENNLWGYGGEWNITLVTGKYTTSHGLEVDMTDENIGVITFYDDNTGNWTDNVGGGTNSNFTYVVNSEDKLTITYLSTGKVAPYKLNWSEDKMTLKYTESFGEEVDPDTGETFTSKMVYTYTCEKQ